MSSINPYSRLLRPLTASQLKALKAPQEKLSKEYEDWGEIILNPQASNNVKKTAKLERGRIRRLQRHRRNKLLNAIENAAKQQQICLVLLAQENKDQKTSSSVESAIQFNRFADVLDTREPQSSDESGSHMSYDYDSRDDDSSVDSSATDGYPDDGSMSFEERINLFYERGVSPPQEYDELESSRDGVKISLCGWISSPDAC